ncbi:PAS domain-containing protein [Hydrogenophaga aquatica]
MADWRRDLNAAAQLVESDVPAAWRQVERLRSGLPEQVSEADHIRLLILRARVLEMLSEVQTAATLAQEALERARRTGDKALQAESHLLIGLIGLVQGNLGLERQSVQDALTVLGDVQRPDLLAEAMLRAALHYWRTLQQDAAVTMAMHTMDIAKRSGDPRAMVFANRALGVLYQQVGRDQDSIAYFEQMRASARAVGSRLQESYALEGVAAGLRALGRLEEAEPAYRDVLEIRQKLGSPFNMASAVYGYADMLRGQQRHSEAVQYLDQALAIYRQHPNPLGSWRTLNARSTNMLALGRLDAAQADADAALAIGQQAGLAFMKAESTKNLAAIAAAEGNHRKAYDLLAQADELQSERDRSQSSERMLELTQRYRLESQQREIEELKNQDAQSELQMRWLWTVFAASVVLFALTAYFLVRQRRSNAQLALLNAQLQQSRNQLQATIEAIPDPLFVVDRQGTYLDVHTSHPELLAAPPELLLGKKAIDVLPPDAARTCLEAIEEALKHGASVGREMELPLPIGSRWFEVSIALKKGRPQSDPRFVVMSRDITDRKRAEQQLHASEQMFRAIVENSPDIIVRLDRDCRRIYINPAMQKLAGVDPSRLLGKTPLETYFVDTPEARATAHLAEDSVREVIKTGKAIERETFWGVVNGRRLHFYTLYAPEFDQEGNVVGVVSVARDIRELKEKELNLEASRNMLRVLAARRDSAREEERKRIAREIHDELGQMLTAFRLDIATLKFEHGRKDPAVAQRCQKLIDMTDQTIQVVRNIASALRPASLDMGMSAALEWLANEFQARTGVPCQLRISPTLGTFNEEQSTAVFRIVQESLTNVARYAQATEVGIELKPSSAGCTMSIRDNGKGFDPDGVRSRSFGLMGIRERALMLGGDARIDSVPGHGTTVEVDIPWHDNSRRRTA